MATASGRESVHLGPAAIEEVIRKRAPRAVRIALETGPLCVWHCDEVVKTVITSLLSAWKTVTLELEKLDGQIEEIVQGSPAHTNLMTVSGVGVITAAAYVATIDSPERFSSAKPTCGVVAMDAETTTNRISMEDLAAA